MERILSVLCCIVLSLSITLALVIPPSNPNIRYSGRIGTGYSFEWSGIEISARFTGTSLGVIFKDEWNDGNMYNVFIDGSLAQVITVSTTMKTYPIASRLSAGTHSVLITKRTEAFFGPSTFGGFQVDDGASLVTPSPPPNRRIEFIGDSITCGYGNEGVFPCHFSGSTENNYFAYGPVIARALNAEYYLEAWSGMGMVRNYGDANITSKVPFPALYRYTQPTDNSTKWNFSKWVPHAIVINLGTNDYSTQPYPPADIFEKGYSQFISFLRGVYTPQPKIFVACGPMQGNPSCSYTENAAKSSGATYIDMVNLLSIPDDVGCDYHPNKSGHQKMANKAIPIIKSTMGW